MEALCVGFSSLTCLLSGTTHNRLKNTFYIILQIDVLSIEAVHKKMVRFKSFGHFSFSEIYVFSNFTLKTEPQSKHVYSAFWA